MEHNSDQSSAHQPRTITKGRMVAALMAELDAAGVLVMATGATVSSASKVTCEMKVPFEQTRIVFNDLAGDLGDLSCVALFAGLRVQFQLTVRDAAGYHLPSAVEISDLRSVKRQKFSAATHVAEISTPDGVVMSTPIDLSQDSLAVIAASRQIVLEVGAPVTVTIRGDIHTPDVFSGAMIVQLLSNFGNQQKIVMGFRTRPLANARKVSRAPVSLGTLDISPVASTLGKALTLELRDISMSGIKAIVAQTAESRYLVSGVQVALSFSGVMATVVWREHENIGIRINGLDNSGVLAKWVKHLNHIRSESGVEQSELDEFSGLLTFAGFLKGSRRKVFGEHVSAYLPPMRVTENPSLFLRHVVRSQDGELYGHLSLARLTENTWVMQEGAHSGVQGVGFSDLVVELLRRAKELTATSKGSPRYYISVTDVVVRTSDAIATSFASQAQNRSFDSLKLSLDSSRLYNGHNLSSLVDVKQQDAAYRRKAFDLFDPVLVEVFAGLDGSHPRLNSELSTLGPSHDATTVYLSDDQGVYGLVFRLKSYYALNASGVLNSVFVVIAGGITSERIKNGLACIAADEISHGTDDLLLIFDQPPSTNLLEELNLREAKKYNLMAVDIILNRVHVESDDEAAHLVRKQK